jgi:hypothetical protein
MHRRPLIEARTGRSDWERAHAAFERAELQHPLGVN